MHGKCVNRRLRTRKVCADSGQDGIKRQKSPHTIPKANEKDSEGSLFCVYAMHRNEVGYER